jgi:phosphoglycolate phosphatase-like HAD superfamily hydrolase
MREIPSNSPYPLPDTTEKLQVIERRSVASLLHGPQGEKVEIPVAIAEDGNLMMVNFWDIDKTLLWPKAVQFAAIPRMFPNAVDVDNLRTTFEAGWGLGTPYREFDRLIRIFQEGDLELKDVEIYRKKYIANDLLRKKIDEAGHPEGWHERAFSAVDQYSYMLRDTVLDLYAKNPDFFKSETFVNGPLMHLLQAKTRLGQTNVIMTSNPGIYASELVAVSGLYKFALALSPGEDMVGGGKEICIKKLIKTLEAMGLKVPKDRLVVIGDSERGDIGSGYKIMQSEKGWRFSGILVRKDMSEADLFKEAAISDDSLLDIVTGMDMTLIASDEVPEGRGGYRLGRKGSTT